MESLFLFLFASSLFLAYIAYQFKIQKYFKIRNWDKTSDPVCFVVVDQKGSRFFFFLLFFGSDFVLKKILKPFKNVIQTLKNLHLVPSGIRLFILVKLPLQKKLKINSQYFSL